MWRGRRISRWRPARTYGLSRAAPLRLGKLGSNTEQLLGQAPAVTCHEVLGFLKQASKSQLQQRAVPSWCAHLRHPNTNVCGIVHEPDLPKPPKPSSFANLRASGPSGE